MEKKHINIRVSGKVQGVYYRASTAKTARALGIKGFVRNMQDGTVYLEAEGAIDQLDQLKRWCQRGPIMAKVTEVNVKESKVVGFEMFEVKY